MNQHWVTQAFRFGGVGGLATLMHVIVAYVAMLVLDINPLGANLAGFLCAFVVSYIGNSYWTFSGRIDHAAQITRFAISSFMCFLLSNAVVFSATALLKWRFEIALVVIVILVPPLNFSLAKFWAFRSRGGLNGEAPDKALRS